MVWATGVVNILCQEKDGLGYWCSFLLLIFCVRRKMVWATRVVNILCQEKDGLGYWCSSGERWPRLLACC